MLNINVGQCTNNPETCPVVGQLIEMDNFYGTLGPYISDHDPNNTITSTREVLARFFDLCCLGKCPGIDPETTYQSLRNRNYI